MNAINDDPANLNRYCWIKVVLIRHDGLTAPSRRRAGEASAHVCSTRRRAPGVGTTAASLGVRA